MMYTPDGWMIVKITGTNPHYRVFGSWRGGYLSGDSWRMNSGIISVKEDGEKLLVKSEEEYTSPVVKIYKVETEYLVITENSIYMVDINCPTKRIS